MPIFPCPDCNNYGKIVVTGKHGEMELDCHCHLRLLAMQNYEKMRVYDTFPAARYGTVHPDDIQQPAGGSPKGLRLWEKARLGTLAYIDNPDGFITFSGTSGTSKTHFSALIYLHSGLPAIWLSMTNFTKNMARLFSARNGELSDMIDALAAIPLLVMDDIGRGGLEASPGVQANIFTVIDQRYGNRMPTVFTTNVNTAVMTAETPAIASRVLAREDDRPNIFYCVVDDFRRRTIKEDADAAF